MQSGMFPEWCKKVEIVLDNAYKAGRTQLFEYEVYEILGIMGMRLPAHIIIRNEHDITNHTLSLFSSNRIVLKIISRDIAHKEKSGGVAIVHKDLGFIKYSYSKMIEEFKKNNVDVEGVMLVEHIEYSKDLGNEILLGFRESETFGPVISFSKGGSDAVHFATHFSPPNIILPPINREWALALLSSAGIYEKYIDEGKSQYISSIVETQVKLSDLSINFSNFFSSTGKYVLKEFEMNPFVFDRDSNFVALDGYATFDKKDSEVPPLLSIPPRESLRPFFKPNGIAVIGVSRKDNNRPGNIVISNLIDLERDDVYCVNIKGGETTIADRKFSLYKSIKDIKEHIDMAIITIGAAGALQTVKECADKKVKVIVLVSGGFSEVTKDKKLEEDILQICRKNNIRIMGPNCLGILYTGNEHDKGVTSFFIPEKKFKVNPANEKNVAILTQSGGMGMMEIYNLRNAISPSAIVSYGNQLDVDPADLIQYFEEDPTVDVIGLYIEGFKKAAGRNLFNVASRCTKPVVVYKAGRTEIGVLAAQSHTASISGEYAVTKAAMKQAGLIVADTMIDHGDFVKTFALLHDFQITGNKVAVIANAGYEKTYAADNMGDLQLATLKESTKAKLKEQLPPIVNVETLLDLSPMVSDEQFTNCIEILLNAKEIDALCISIVPQAQVIHTTDEEIAAYEKNIAAQLVKLIHKYRKPVVISVNVTSGANAVYNKFGQVMDTGGVPTFLTAGRAMTCLNEFIRYALIKEKNVFSEWLR